MNKLTLASTHLRWTFMRTCSPRISVNGPNMFTQSFLSGVMRWGGIGIRRVSDLSVVFCALAGRGSNVGAADGCAMDVGSTSIISSSSSSLGTVSVMALSLSLLSASCISSSWSPAGLGAPFFLPILRRFFLGAAALVDGVAWVETIFKSMLSWEMVVKKRISVDRPDQGHDSEHGFPWSTLPLIPTIRRLRIRWCLKD